MKTLDQIGIEMQTDKASVFTRTYAKPKDYLKHYERFFAPLRMDPLRLIEIGAAGGESVRMWLEYFPSGQVYGIDINHNTNPYNTDFTDVHPRYNFIHADQSDPTMWACLASDTGGDWDIVVDDGSHDPKDIINAFEGGWQFMRSGGYWCVEDLGCGFKSEGFPSHLEWLGMIMNNINQGHKDVESLHFSQELAILRKK